jgi:predicted O-methyltransferase YrrM
MSKFHIVAIRPPGFLHTSGFAEIIDSLSWALSSLGHDVVICENTFSKDGTNILFGAELLSKEQALPDNVIIYNLEQGVLHPAWENIKRLAKGKTVWDYNKQNAAEWRRLGYDCQHVPFGFTPNLVRIPKAYSYAWDVFFSGWITARRKKIIDELRAAGLRVAAVDSCYGGARDQMISAAAVCLNVNHDGRTLTNIQRLSFWMANSKCIVTELSSDTLDYDDLLPAMVMCKYEDIVEICRDVVTKGRIDAMGQYAFDAFSKRDYVATVEAALGALPAKNPIMERYERGCREGDMREYLPWLKKNSRGRMLEIGVRDGASTAAILLGLEEHGGHLHSIDISDCTALWTHPRWTFEQNDSKKAIFPDNEFDAAFIDGDHSMDGFLADLHNCFRWVKNGGWIACHDTNPPKTFEEFGGDWPSVAVGQEFERFCKDKGLTNFSLPGGQGMGVLVVKK